MAMYPGAPGGGSPPLDRLLGALRRNRGLSQSRRQVRVRKAPPAISHSETQVRRPNPVTVGGGMMAPPAPGSFPPGLEQSGSVSVNKPVPPGFAQSGTAYTSPSGAL